MIDKAYRFIIVFLLAFTGNLMNISGAEWLPGKDISANYSGQEKTCLKNSLKELSKRDIVVIPTPKNVTIEGAESDIKINCRDLNSKLVIVNTTKDNAAEKWLRKKIRQLGAKNDILRVSTATGLKNKIILFLAKKGKSVSGKDIPAVPQAYKIETKTNGGNCTYVLAGNDNTGLLYAAVTFSKLLVAKKGEVSFPKVKVVDWPDVLYRCVGGLEWSFRRRFWENKAQDVSEAKKYIDWALEHKINILWGVNSNDPYSVIGDPRFRTPAMRKWLKEVNSYAKKYGIIVMLPQTFAVGISKTDKNKPEYKEAIDHRGGLFDWGNDKLLDKKALGINQFLNETDYTGIFIHSLDTRNSRWDDCGKTCRKRFNDDRFSADANLINRLYEQLRQKHPDLFFAVVPRPYVGNLKNPKALLERGEMKNPDDMFRFSRMIPNDVYLCKRESNSQDHKSWMLLKQPLFVYVSSSYAYIPLNSRLISPMFRFAKTFFKPLGKDVFFYCSNWPQSDVMNIGAIEYSWNLYAPGSALYEIPGYREKSRVGIRHLDEIWDAFGNGHSRNLGLQAFIRRACIDLYGEKWGSRFTKAFISFIDWNLVYDTKTICQKLRDAGYLCDRAQCAEWFKRIQKDSSAAIKDLEKVLDSNVSGYTREAAAYFLSRLYLIHAGASVLAQAKMAETAAKNRNINEARQHLQKMKSIYRAQTELLKKKWAVLHKQPSLRPIPTLSNAIKPFVKLKSIIALVKVKVESRIELLGGTAVRQSSAPKRFTKKQNKENKPLQVAIFDPSSVGGKVYGADGLKKLLAGQLDMRVTETVNLNRDNLEKYDCIVIPDCKNFGSVKFNITDIRNYVAKHGGGVYFEHDSCGFQRFPLQTSIFPEIAEVEKQIGTHIKDRNYKQQDRLLRIIKKHSVTDGFKLNSRFEQSYYDHLQLKPNREAAILVSDCYGKPVIVCGEFGAGRVMFNGALTYMDTDQELTKPLAGMEGQIILNGIRWLCNKENYGLLLHNQKKEDKVLADGTYSLLSFIPEIILFGENANAVLTACCFETKNNRQLTKEIVIARPGTISNRWKAPQEIEVKVDEYSEIMLVLSLKCSKGSLQRSYIFK